MKEDNAESLLHKAAAWDEIVDFLSHHNYDWFPRNGGSVFDRVKSGIDSLDRKLRDNKKPRKPPLPKSKSVTLKIQGEALKSYRSAKKIMESEFGVTLTDNEFVRRVVTQGCITIKEATK